MTAGDADLWVSRLPPVHPRYGDHNRKGGGRPTQGPGHNSQRERLDVQVMARYCELSG